MRRIRSLQKRGDFKQSKAFTTKLIGQGYTDSNVMHLHGLALRGCGELHAASEVLEKAHELDPTNAAIVNSLGLICQDLGRVETAIELFKIATKIDQKHYGSWINLGKALRNSDRLQAAELAFTCAHNIERDNPEPLLHLTDLLIDTGAYDRAQAFVSDLLSKPDAAVSQLKLKKMQIAARQQNFDLIAELYPQFDRQSMTDNEEAVLENIWAFSLEMQERYEDAIQALKPWVKKQTPHRFLLQSQLAGLYSHIGDIDKAIQLHHEILDVDPNNVAGRYNLSLLQFRAGQIEDAYRNNEARWQWNEFSSRRRQFDTPRWNGEPLSGKKILVWREQGLGDEIRFASLLPDLQKLGADVTFECTPKLLDFWMRNYPWADIKQEGPVECRGSEEYAHYDYQIPIGSLGAHFRKTLQSYKEQRPWVLRDPESETQIREQIGVSGEELLIGLCWRSSNQVTSRSRYFFNINQFAPFEELPQVKFLNVQYDAATEEIEQARESGLPLHHYTNIDQKDDLIGAAKLLGACDLVITVGGAVGDLAGALGIPLLYITRENSEVYLGTDYVPWFPTAKSYPIKPYRGDEVVSEINNTWPQILDWLETVATKRTSSLSPGECGHSELRDFSVLDLELDGEAGATTKVDGETVGTAA